MPQTPTYGFEFETPQSKPGITLTGDINGSSPILAEQVEIALAGVDARVSAAESDIAILQAGAAHDTGWVALSTTAATGFSVVTSLYRHWGPIVAIHLIITRTGATLTANASGNLADTLICAINTTNARPTQLTYTAIQSTVTSGTALVNSTGAITIGDIHSSSSINTDDNVRIMTMYFAPTFN